MEAYELVHLIDQQDQSAQDYLEFLRVPSLSAGLYMLAAGAVDMQEPVSYTHLTLPTIYSV